MSKNPPSMAEVIDRLFTRLAASYGAEWTRQWDGVPIGDVKTAWGHELAGFAKNLPAIAHALENLPERCPNVIQFHNLCRTAPGPVVVFLPQPKADPARVAAELAKMVPAAAVGRLDWARRLQAKDEMSPSSVTPTIRKMYRDALGLNRVLPQADSGVESAGQEMAAQGAQA